jgi:hypothetical protein
MAKEPRGWLMCDKDICLYREDVRLSRCVKHGAILAYRPWLTGCRTRDEARAVLKKSQPTTK